MKAIHRLIYYLWKRNALLQLQICSPNKIFQYITRVQIPYKVKGSLILKPPPPHLGGLTMPPQDAGWLKGGIHTQTATLNVNIMLSGEGVCRLDVTCVAK